MYQENPGGLPYQIPTQNDSKRPKNLPEGTETDPKRNRSTREAKHNRRRHRHRLRRHRRTSLQSDRLVHHRSIETSVSQSPMMISKPPYLLSHVVKSPLLIPIYHCELLIQVCTELIIEEGRRSGTGTGLGLGLGVMSKCSHPIVVLLPRRKTLLQRTGLEKALHLFELRLVLSWDRLTRDSVIRTTVALRMLGRPDTIKTF